MISSNYDFARFIDAVKEKDHFDIIYLAEQEATEAWRKSAHKRFRDSPDMQINLSYQSKLLGLIDYMRHGLQSQEFTSDDRKLLQQLSH